MRCASSPSPYSQGARKSPPLPGPSRGCFAPLLSYSSGPGFVRPGFLLIPHAMEECDEGNIFFFFLGPTMSMGGVSFLPAGVLLYS